MEDIREKNRFSALYVRNFRLFWFGQIISYSGSWMQSIALGWLVYSLTKSSFYLGLVAAASNLPFILFALIGGVFADRVRKKQMLVITQVLSMLPALILAVLTDLQAITFEEIILVAFFLGTVNAFDIPARQSFLADIVSKAGLMNAIALNSAAFNGARIIGPVAAGLTIAAMGIAACFYINALSFLAVVAALLLIRGKGDEDRAAAHKLSLSILLRDLREGLRFVWKEKDIFRVIFLVAAFSVFGIPFVTFLPVFAEGILKSGAKGLGFLAGASGVGALAAALIIAFARDIKQKGRYMFIAGLTFSVSLSVFALSENFYVSAAALAVSGWSIISFFATGNSFIQLKVPDMLRGRVMSVYTLVFFGTAPVGNAALGVIAEIYGVQTAIFTGAAACLSLIILSGRLRHMR